MADDALQLYQGIARPLKWFSDPHQEVGSSRQRYASQEEVYNSFSGADISATIVVPGEETPLNLGELQTISYSIHRENTPVRTLGHVNPRGFVQGPRTIAGSLIFTQFNAYAFYRLEQYRRLIAEKAMYPLADMLPPFDVTLTFANEYGLFAKKKIYGITVVDEGGTMSVDDLIIEQTYTYMARGIQPLVPYLPENYERLGSGVHTKTKAGNSLEFR